MSAVLESLASPVTEARGALDEARRELAQVDSRIRGYEQEADTREFERQRHLIAVKIAVAANQSIPKPPKARPSDAEVALPILRGSRKALTERIAECEGRLRGACVGEVERRYDEARHEFASASAMLIEAWRELVGARQLLDQAGVKGQSLPESLYSDFTIPAFGPMRPICENHTAHFVASHTIAQGELARTTRSVRDAVERDIGMKLPW